MYFEVELVENQTTEDFSVVQKEGNKKVNRVNSLRGTQLRIWATQKLLD